MFLCGKIYTAQIYHCNHVKVYNSVVLSKSVTLSTHHNNLAAELSHHPKWKPCQLPLIEDLLCALHALSQLIFLAALRGTRFTDEEGEAQERTVTCSDHADHKGPGEDESRLI